MYNVIRNKKNPCKNIEQLTLTKKINLGLKGFALEGSIKKVWDFNAMFVCKGNVWGNKI